MLTYKNMRSKPGDEDQVPDHVDEAVETVENTETVEENTPSDTIIVDENYEDEIDEEALLQQKMRQRHVASVRNKVYIFVL
jgi:quinol monooxygenase YgiN